MTIDELKTYISDPSAPESVDILQNENDELISNGDISERMEFADYISEILAREGKEMERRNPQVFEQYQAMWLMLVFNSFVSLSHDDQGNILQKRILNAVQRGFQPESIIEQLQDFYYNEEFIRNLLLDYAKILEENTETLGNAPLEVQGQKLFPQIKYWIEDYKSFPTQVAQRTSLERLNYVNKSANARQLTQVQRNALLQILKFYDDCLNPKLSVRAPKDLNNFLEKQETKQENLQTINDNFQNEVTDLDIEKEENYYQPPVPPQYNPKQKPTIPVPPPPKVAAPTAPSSAIPSKEEINIQQKLRDLKDRLNK